MRSFPIALYLAFQLLTPALASAQSTTVAGVVKDEAGSGLPGALVELRSSQQLRTTTTDDRGAYRFERLPEGRLDLSVTLAQFAAGRRSPSART
jgi:hypothetical protein